MSPFPDTKEIDLIKNYIVLPYAALTILDRDKKVFESAPFKFPCLYTDWIVRVMDNVTKELAETRKEMRKTGIYVYQQEKTEKGVEVKYGFRGYHYSSIYLSQTLSVLVQTKIQEYILPHNPTSIASASPLG